MKYAKGEQIEVTYKGEISSVVPGMDKDGGPQEMLHMRFPDGGKLAVYTGCSCATIKRLTERVG